MNREFIDSQHSIALLATGDEIVNGDILNTNAQEIAQRLFAKGFNIKTHMTVKDNVADIQSAIRYLLTHHNALIITGGLGPTTDDLTRFALANAINRELLFDEQTWDRIVERLTRLGYKIPSENNRQQALFPEQAVIIPNSHGTASGCIAMDDEQRFIFMLPGPPAECLPMIDKVVIQALELAKFKQTTQYAKWLLFGVGEGYIAEQLEEIIKPFDCTSGYRVCYPYVEIKLYSNNKHDFDQAVPLVEEAMSAYMIDNGQATASELLKKKIASLTHPLNIIDNATGGSLEATIKTPDTYQQINFISDHTQIGKHAVSISGLEHYWKHESVSHTTLDIIFYRDNIVKPQTFTIPCRGSRVKLYAVEFICQQLLHYLT